MSVHPNAVTDSLDAADPDAGTSPAPHRIETDRLVLYRAHPETVEFDRLHALFSEVADSEEVFELCGWTRHEDEAETRAYLAEKADQWERGEFYEYVLAADGEYVGTACLEVAENDGSGEFGFWLRKPHWGRGFCGEGVDALLYTAFECLDAPFVVAGCLPANDRSRRAIEKFVRRYGGAYFGSPPIVSSRDDGEEAVTPHHEWAVTREQYDSGERGISTTIPGVEYDDVEF